MTSQDERDAAWNEALEAAAHWHDEQAAYAARKNQQSQWPVEHPFQMAEKIDPEFWSRARRFHENSAARIRALKRTPGSRAMCGDRPNLQAGAAAPGEKVVGDPGADVQEHGHG